MPQVSPNRGAEIRSAAETILARIPAALCGFNLLRSVAKREGIEILDAALGDLAGTLRRVDGRWHIHLNCQDAPTRRCGTLARLLGHHTLHAGAAGAFALGGVLLRRDTPTATEEWEAREFAAELLMPRTIIERRLPRRPTDAEILSLARWCGVSRRELARRLRTLGYAVNPWG